MWVKLLTLAILCMLVTGPAYGSDSADASPSNQVSRNNHQTQAQPAAEWSTPRDWETEVMGVKVRGTAQRRSNDLKGVLHIYPPFSDKWTYHWTGKIEGDKVHASHTDGHVFQGSITPERMVEGIITTRDGRQIPLKTPLP